MTPFDATLIVLAKSPRPGRVKTRLCPPCTPEQAAAIAAAALEDTLETVGAVAVRWRMLVLDGPVGPWLTSSKITVIPQVEGGLGDRLAAAFAAARGPALLVGMDTPQLTVREVAAALVQLADPDVDAVLGLATDGGWWGLGLMCPDARVFAGVTMSSSQTGVQQLAQLHRLGLATRMLPELSDVDHFADAKAVARISPGSRFATAVAAVEASVTPIARAS